MYNIVVSIQCHHTVTVITLVLYTVGIVSNYYGVELIITPITSD